MGVENDATDVGRNEHRDTRPSRSRFEWRGALHAQAPLGVRTSHHLCFGPQAAQHAHDEFGDLVNTGIVGTDAGMSQILEQTAEEPICVRLDVMKHAQQFRAGCWGGIRTHGPQFRLFGDLILPHQVEISCPHRVDGAPKARTGKPSDRWSTLFGRPTPTL